MILLEQIEQDYITALKARETQKVDTLRLIKNALKNEAIKIGGLGAVLTDAQAMAVLNKEVKQRKDAIEQYTAGSRADLAAKEQAELEIIGAYLPKGLTEEELQQIVEATLAETQATTKTDMGKVMAVLKQKLTNPADISRAASIVSQKLL